jgi:LETM1 and EF-hand domain-containing protein 1
MISSIEKELSNYDQEVGTKLNLVKTNDEGQISISDLEEALKVIRDRPNDERIKKIVNQLDGDHDGLVAMNEILMLVQDKEGHGEIIEVLKEVINEKESKKQ